MHSEIHVNGRKNTITHPHKELDTGALKAELVEYYREIAPYAARAERGIPIASPFEWDELPNISPTSYSIRNYPKEDAWRDFFARAVLQKQALKEPLTKAIRLSLCFAFSVAPFQLAES